MELNAEQVIKALEWCSELRLCVDCPMRAEGYFSHSGNACRKALMENALSLIKQLTQAHEMLSESYDHLEKTKDELLAERSRLTEENEKIGIENFDLICELSRIKENTVREMQTRLAQRIGTYTDKSFVYISAMFKLIDQIAKELIGDA